MAYVGETLAPLFRQGPEQTAINNMVRLGVVYAQGEAARNTPVFTGNLRESWEVSDEIRRTMTAFGIGYKADWLNQVEYAEYVDLGTGLWGPEHRKYLILPRTPGGTLHWVDRLTGEDRFAKSVMAPGSPGHHMLAISAAMLESSWTHIVRPALDHWVREVENRDRTFHL